MKVSKKEQKARKMAAHRKALQDYITLKQKKYFAHPLKSKYLHTEFAKLFTTRLVDSIKEWNEHPDMEPNPCMPYKGSYTGKAGLILHLLDITPFNSLGFHSVYQSKLQMNTLCQDYNLQGGCVDLEEAYYENEFIQETDNETNKKVANQIKKQELIFTPKSDVGFLEYNLYLLADKIFKTYISLEDLNQYYYDCILSDLEVLPKITHQEFTRLYNECVATHREKQKNILGSKTGVSDIEQIVQEELNSNQYFQVVKALSQFVTRLNIQTTHINLTNLKTVFENILNDEELSVKEKREQIYNLDNAIKLLNDTDRLSKYEDEGNPLVESHWIIKSTESSNRLDTFDINDYRFKPIWNNVDIIGFLDSRTPNIPRAFGQPVINAIQQEFGVQVVTDIMKLKFKYKHKVYNFDLSLTEELGKKLLEQYKNFNIENPPVFGMVNTPLYSTLRFCSYIKNNPELIQEIHERFNLSPNARLYNMGIYTHYDLSSIDLETLENSELYIQNEEDYAQLTQKIRDDLLNKAYLRADKYLINTSVQKIKDYIEYTQEAGLDEQDISNISKTLLMEKTDGWFSAPFFSDEVIKEFYDQRLLYLNAQDIIMGQKPTRKTTAIILRRKRMLKAQKEKFLYSQKKPTDTGKKYEVGNGLIQWYTILKISELLINPLDRETQTSKEYATERCHKMLEHLKKICDSLEVVTFED